MKLINRLRAIILGIDGDKLEAIQTLLNGYLPPRGRHNSLIIGGPTAWSWQATLDDAHHGSRGSGLHADSHNRQHAMDSPSDHSAGTAGDILRAGSAGVWQRLAVGSDGQVLTVVGGLPSWSSAPPPGDHGNESHTPDFYPLNGSEELTAPLWMQLMSPASEPSANAGNEGKLYYLTPGTSTSGLLKQVMKNSTGSFELVQVSMSTWEVNMALIDELQRKKAEIEAEMLQLDKEAAEARDLWERTMTNIRQRRQKLEEVLGMVTALLQKEVA